MEGSRSTKSIALVPLSLTLAAGLAVIAVFAALGGAGFLSYDDPLMVSENPVVHKGLTAEGVGYAFTDTTMNLWHPLTWMSHMLDWQLFGDWAGGHHLTSVLLHASNTALVFALLSALSKRAALSFTVALLFGLHPMQVESVAWISERKDVLSTFFYLATALAYVRWTQVGRKVYYIGAVALCLLGFLSKPSLMTLPFALLLLDFWPLGRVDLSSFKTATRSVATLAWGKAPFFAMAGMFAVVAMKVQSAGGLSEVSTFLSFPERLAVTGLAYGSYLVRTFWPSGLAPFYAHPETLSPMLVALCWALLLGVSAAAILLVKRAPYVFFGWFWFVGLILPASGIITISDNFAPDRYAYLAHLGLFVAVVWGTADLLQRWKFPVVVPRLAGGLTVAVFAVLCFQQVAVWKSDESLWRHAVAVTERNYFAHDKLGVHLLKTGRADEGISELQRSVELRPGYAFGHANLGMALSNRGDATGAIEHFSAGVKIKPRDLRMRCELVGLLGQAGRHDDLPPHLKVIVELAPRDPKAHYDYATVLQNAGEAERAIEHYRAAVELTPSANFLVRGDLGGTLMQLKRYHEAIPYLQQAAAEKRNPYAPRAHYLLGIAHRHMGDEDAAAASFSAALEADPKLLVAQRALDALRADGAE